MKILFINPQTSKYTRSISTPLGLLSIATYMESKGHTVKIYDRNTAKAKLKDVIYAYNPDIAGISLMSYKSINDSLYVAQVLKESAIPVIIGGPLPSELAEMTLEYDCFDMVSIGEGEATWSDIVSYYEGKIKDVGSIRGIAYKNQKGEVIRTQKRDFMNLAEIPPINWSLIDVPKYFQSSYGCDKMLYLYSAKGCPFNCTFCYNKEFHRCTYRKRPLEFLIEEIKVLVQDYGMDGVYFADELWCKNREEMHEICDTLRALDLDFVWGCQTRIGIFELEDFEYMYKSGCRWVYFGVESGSKTVLERIKKRIDYEKIEQSFRDCSKANIACIGSFIIGFPDETSEDVKETIKLIKKLDTRLINYNYLAIVPGSEIYKDLVADGRYIEVKNLKDFGRRYPLERLEYNFSLLPANDIRVIRAFFLWRSFTARDIPSNGNYGFAKKVITDAIKSIRTGDFLSFVLSTFYAAAEFVKVFFYSHFFVSVKKKYGLNTFGK